MRISLATSLISLLLIPIIVSAATVDELTAQIQALLQQVTALQSQYGGTAGTQVPVTTPGVPSAAQCPYISRVLKRGASGVDVTRLQQFLATDPAIYPEAQVSGYYGALTEAAVKRFQCKNKLVCDGTPETTGYGVAGPRTAALLALQCPNGGSVGGGTGADAGGFIRVTPTAGGAPLLVSIEATVNTTRSCTGGTYEVIYGDNSPSATIVVPSNFCAEMRQTLSHSYNAQGTYSVILRAGTHQTSATVTVSGTGTGASSSLFSRTPASGSAPLLVIFSGTLNATGACYTGQYTLQFGDNQSATVLASSCAPSTYSVSHTYQNNGNYTAGLYRGSDQLATLPITVSSSGSQSQTGGPFSVTAGTGGNPFAVSAQFALASSCARYDLDWGDGTSHSSQEQGTCGDGETTKSLTHTYANTGQYTLTLKRGSTLSITDTIGLTIVQ